MELENELRHEKRLTIIWHTLPLMVEYSEKEQPDCITIKRMQNISDILDRENAN